MAIELSNRTIELIDRCLPEAMRNQIKNLLLESVSENIPYCDNSTPEEMDRIRFAIIKLVLENNRNLDNAVQQAKTDWRDLIMMAGFGHDTGEHNKWFARVTNANSG